eukprot:8563609-Alexandrium_andersonii.AAC.1
MRVACAGVCSERVARDVGQSNSCAPSRRAPGPCEHKGWRPLHRGAVILPACVRQSVFCAQRFAQ